MTTASFRIRTAAVLLGAPLAAALFAAQPAHAQVTANVYLTPQIAQAPVRVVEFQPGLRTVIDRRAPVISELMPANGERVAERGRTHISARIEDSRSGIDYRSIVLRVDGRNVTQRARIENGRIEFREDLAPGRHHAELSVRDRAGNSTREAWNFDVIEPGRNPGRRYGFDEPAFGRHG